MSWYKEGTEKEFYAQFKSSELNENIGDTKGMIRKVIFCIYYELRKNELCIIYIWILSYLLYQSLLYVYVCWNSRVPSFIDHSCC